MKKRNIFSNALNFLIFKNLLDNEIDAINMMTEMVGSIQLQGEFTSR